MTRNHDKTVKLMIVAGEPSGDAHAAALVHALRKRIPRKEFEFFGSTGAKMREAGVESIVRADDLAIVGLLEIGAALRKFWRAFRELKQVALERKPDAVILVDWPDFNLRLARSLHKQGLRVIYYISPQLWAWRSYRVRNIHRDVDLLLAILPFETEWYSERGVGHVEFVGHPLAGAVKPEMGREEFCERHDLNPSLPIIALLPGSRHKELVRILPPMLDAASLMAITQPEIQFVLALAPNRDPAEAELIIKTQNRNGFALPERLRIVQHETREALAAADAAAVASGTATLEAALVGTPLVVVYKESLLNWLVLGSLIKVGHYGLVNLIAGERLATELLQDDLTDERLANELRLLLDEKRNREFRAQLVEAASRLGTGGASSRAAEVILQAIQKQDGRIKARMKAEG
jgi:lipid-A-disaccharide synthase